MSVQIKGSGTIGGLDEGLVVSGIVTSSTQLNVGSNIKFGSAGIATASNFKTGSSNLHSTGLTVGNNFLHTTGINVGTGATIHVPSSNVLTFGTNSAERLRIQSDGTLVTGAQTIPTSSDIGNIYIKNASAIGSPSHQINYVSNAVFNGSWKYITSGFGATQIIVNQSLISYGFAGSGTAGNNITFSEKFRITSGGNVYVGQTSGSEQLGVDGGSNAQTFSTNSTNSNGNMLQVKCSGTAKLFLGSAGSFITGNTGTTNQGIRAEGDLLFAAGGHSEKMRLTSTGLMGVGTNNPQKNLHVYAGGVSTLRIETGDSRGQAWDILSTNGAQNNTGTLSFRDESGSAYLEFGANGGSPELTVRNGGANDLFNIDNSGHVTKPYHPSFLSGGKSGYSGSVDNAYQVVYPATEYFDVGNNMNISNGRFTAPVDGKYFFFFCGLIYPMGPNNFSQMEFRKNNSRYGQYVQFNGTDGNHRNMSFSCVMDMSAGDYCTHTFYRSSGQSQNIYNSQWNFGGYLIG